MPTNSIKDIKILATIVNGKAIYEAEGAPTIKPTTPTTLFVDTDNHWAKGDIEKAVAAKYLIGVSDKEFAPNAKVTRAMVVAVLHRLAGSPKPEKGVSFKDVPADEWYANSIGWAHETGVVSGLSKDTFAPMEPVTREQLAAMLANDYKKTGQKPPENDQSLKVFKDQPSPWAERQMNWAVTTGLIGGMSQDVLAPQGEASRAQLAAILNRYVALNT